MSTTALMITFGLNRHDVRLGWLTAALLARLSFWMTELFACRLPTSNLNYRHSLHDLVFFETSPPMRLTNILQSHCPFVVTARLNRLQQHSVEGDWCSLPLLIYFDIRGNKVVLWFHVWQVGFTFLSPRCRERVCFFSFLSSRTGFCFLITI